MTRSSLRAFGHDARVGGEHAVDVGVDLADVRLEGRRERDRRGVRAAAPERRHVVGRRVDALEPGDDGHGALRDRLPDAAGRHVDDAGLAVGLVGEHARLLARERLGVDAQVVDRHGQQRHRDPLAGGQQDVHLALRRQRRHLLGEVDELVRRVTHRADDDHDVVARPLRLGDPLGDALDAGGVGDGGTAVLLHDQCHGGALSRARERTGRVYGGVHLAETRFQMADRHRPFTDFQDADAVPDLACRPWTTTPVSRSAGCAAPSVVYRPSTAST